ncbi:hydantoinase/oxoprolinase family protein [Azoarcus sp. TTM-91]|uniref:hydantoinase/oxoprolinase family protein n=1 Tax=Azoarcus sp. TTM-91 TaxID=2691581 RepID=UPI00145EAAF8|nr:hydantoinase/oxoprolinase family protein [Azoarcus sp. TTM-91]
MTPNDKTARIGADIGGTFTDVVLETPSRRYSIKVLTTYDAPERGLLDGVAALLAQAGLAPADVGFIVHGTTLATNAILERRGARTALLTTAGFRDVLELGTESRFDQYDITMDAPAPLIPRPLRRGVPERIAAGGEVLLALDEDAVRAVARDFLAAGVESVAVAFLHSYANPAHERRAGEILAEAMPGVTVSLSCEVSPEMREYERFSTTAANAYVQPIVASYLGRLDAKLRAGGFDCALFLMLSSGGLTTVQTAARFPVRLVESGPAGGAIFAASIAAERGIDRMLALDVGGTTAKICFVDQGRPKTSQVFEVDRAHRFRKGSGLPLRIPVIEMVEIGAGGGSIARLDGTGRLTVGPQSASSEPGPACYGRGGAKPTVTDADLVLGRIDPTAFAGGKLRLDETAAATAMDQVRAWEAGPQVLALGISEIVDEAMASAVRVHAMEQGATVEDRSLVAFGGAAPLHAARIAEKLGIAEVVIPRSAGVGSAVGFLRAPVAYELSRSLHQRIAALDLEAVNAMLAEMGAQAREVVSAGGGDPAALVEQRVAYARYCGQGYEIAIDVPARPLTEADRAGLLAAFEAAYRAQYGGVVVALPVEILTWRLTVAAPAPQPVAVPGLAPERVVTPDSWRKVMDPASGQVHDFALVRRAGLRPGDHVAGPALIVEEETTTVVSPAFGATVDANHYLVLRRQGETAGARA